MVILALALAALAAPSAGSTPPDPAPHYAEFARRVQQAIAAGDPTVLDDAFRVDAVVRRATTDLEVPKHVRAGFEAGLESRLALGEDICALVADGGSFDLLRIYEQDGVVHALFRLITDGVTYQDMILTGDPESGFLVEDIYFYAMGEWFSATIRRNLMQVLATENASFMRRLLGKEAAFLRHAHRLEDIHRLVQREQFEEAKAVYESLPPSVQEEKVFLLARVVYSQSISDLEYVQAMAAFSKAFPDDPSLDLILIDFHILREEWDAARRVLDRLEQRVGGDPYLDVIRGHVRLGAGDHAAAAALFRRAVHDEPSLEDGYWALVTLAMEERDYAAVGEQLSALASNFGYEFEDLEHLPYYREFVESAAYEAWVEARRARAR